MDRKGAQVDDAYNVRTRETPENNGRVTLGACGEFPFTLPRLLLHYNISMAIKLGGGTNDRSIFSPKNKKFRLLITIGNGWKSSETLPKGWRKYRMVEFLGNDTAHAQFTDPITFTLSLSLSLCAKPSRLYALLRTD